MPQWPATRVTLLQRIHDSQDQEAWVEFVGLYGPLIFNFARRRLPQDEDAADVLQEVFQAASQSIGDFRRERPGDTFRGWLRAIARHKILSFWRNRSRHPQAAGGSEAWRKLEETPEPDDASEDAADGEQLSGLFHRALGLLRDEFEVRTWQAFWKCAVDGKAPADVGEEMAMKPAAVRQAKSRVLRRLKEELGDLLG